MRLASFSVMNYRSITTARKIQTNNLTVLVGKNNEGKSNILNALSLAMEVMKLYAENPRALNFSLRFIRGYRWERDFPVSLQDKKPDGFSSVDLVFELEEQEIADIRTLTGMRLSGNIPVRVSINHTVAKLDIPKRGSRAFADDTNKQKIIEYVCNKIDFIFIPAVRTETHALQVVESLIRKELSTLEDNPEYIAATDTINRLQQGVLDRIASQIVVPLKNFLPDVDDVKIHIEQEKRRASLLRNIRVVVDDGTPTPIQQKGDGVKSLMALAMLHITERPERVSVVAIEEPESHLHPESAHQLCDTIISLSENHQVVLTTHSPLFVNRSNLKENIIVNDGKATPVKKIKDLREVLGTKVSDNLINAENILLVEGEDDKIVLEKLLPKMSETVKRALQNGILCIDYLGGADNLVHKLSMYKMLQCKIYVLLDNDEAGWGAAQKAESQGLLAANNTTYTVCNGSPKAELEDCLEKTAYIQTVLDVYGVDLNTSQFRGNQKWSDRVAECFKAQGKRWTENVEKMVKLSVAEAIPADPQQALNEHKRSSIDALVAALERML